MDTFGSSRMFLVAIDAYLILVTIEKNNIGLVAQISVTRSVKTFDKKRLAKYMFSLKR